MPTDPAAAVPRRTAAVAALAVAAVLALALGWRSLRDPGVSFLAAHRGAEWILYPAPGNPSLHPALEAEAAFRRSFVLARAPQRAEIHVRAFRRFELAVNGRTALRGDGTTWKPGARADIAPLLRAGENHVEVTVANRTGPPALWARLELPDRALRTDGDWAVSWAGAPWARAALATAPMRGRRFDPDGRARSTVAALADRGRAAVFAVAFSAALVALGAVWTRRSARRRSAPWASPWTMRVALLIAAVAWTALFVHDAPWLKTDAGFDADAHLDYVRHLLERHTLPLADQGWQMYQPPLYYLLAALVLAVTGQAASVTGAAAALRGLGLALGIANLAAIAAALRLVFPDRPRRQLVGLGVATFLAMPLYLYQLPTNEILAATLSTTVLLTTLRVLRAERPPLRHYGLLGLVIGLALLAKLSTLLVVAVALGALLARAAARLRRSARDALAGPALAAGVALLVGGWHYARVWGRFGAPWTANWDAVTGFHWWQDPGYRTIHDYLRFGRVFSDPFFSAFGGVWDGLYSTLWGDGLGSGESVLRQAPPWCGDLMAAGYLAALLPTLALVAGSLVYLARWLRRPAAPEGVTLALGLVTFAAVIAMTLQVPAYGMVKSFYGLGALLPLCVFVAVGVDALSARWRWSSVLALVLLGAWALLSYGAMWVDADSPRARTFRALAELQEGATREGAARLREAMARHPSDWTTRDAMLQFLTWRRAPRSEFAAALGAGERIEPDVAARHVALGHFALLGGDPREAWLEARRAVALDPDLPDARALEATLAERRGDVAGAIAGWREALRIEPFYARAHESLARLLPLAGAPDSAATHRDLAARIRAAGL